MADPTDKSSKQAKNRRIGVPTGFGMFIFVLMLFLVQLLGTNWTGNLITVGNQLITDPNEISTRIAIAEMTLSTGDLSSFDSVVKRLRSDLTANQQKLTTGSYNKYIAQLNVLLSKRGNVTGQNLNNTIGKWETFTENWTDFRDAYLKLAILYHRANNEEMAKVKFQKAFELDPNSEKVAEVRRVLNY